MEYAQHEESPGRWLEVRNALRQRRGELSEIAASLYPRHVRVAGTSLLSCPAWLPRRPVDLDEIHLNWLDTPPAVAVTGTEAELAHVRTVDTGGRPFSSYAASMEALAAPTVFENRWVYRLTAADLTSDEPRLTFCRGQYFDSLNVGEAVGHELAAAEPVAGNGAVARLPLRRAVGDPCVLERRPVSLAVSIVTIRHDPRTNDATCVLHWRDPAKVAHAGGLYQVMPVGVFQPSADSEASEMADFNLWRGTVREYAEEFLGVSESYDDPIDYLHWPLHEELTQARVIGDLKIYCLGMGVDPLTLAVDVMAAAVFDADLFDRMFKQLSDENDEGHVLGQRPSLDPESLQPFLDGGPMQPAGQASLALALRNRSILLQ